MQYHGNNFSLNIPNDWQDSSILSFVAKVGGDEFAPNVVITREPIEKDLSIEDFASRQFAVTQAKVEGLTITERKHFEINGRPAVQLIQKITAHGLNLQQLQNFVLGDEEIFILTCTATATTFDQNLPRFQKIVESFQFDL